jgi:hypothetical protein
LTNRPEWFRRHYVLPLIAAKRGVVRFKFLQQVPFAGRQLLQAHFVHNTLPAIAVVRTFGVPTVARQPVGFAGACHRRAHLSRVNFGRILHPFELIRLSQYVFFLLHFSISFQVNKSQRRTIALFIAAEYDIVFL